MPYFLENLPVEFRSRPLLFIDLEMTGLDPDQHEIVEIAALKVRQPDFTVENSFYTKVIPEHINTADPKSLKVIHYSKEDWQEAIPLKTALTELAQFSPNSILAGWAVQNEWDFLNAAIKRLGLPYFYSHHLIEVYTLAFVKLYHHPEITFLNLPKAAKALDIYLDSHKPDSDIRATYEIFKKLIN